jgi:hypothetical protein
VVYFKTYGSGEVGGTGAGVSLGLSAAVGY